MDVEVFHAAEEAANRAGLSLENWLNEAILDKASECGPHDLAAPRGLDIRTARPSRPFREPDWNGRGPRFREQDRQSRLACTIERIERRVALGEQRAQRALDSIALVLERSDADERYDRPMRAAAEPDVARPALDEAEGSARLSPPNLELSSPSATAEATADKPSTSLESALSQIAARRRQLDARERALHIPASPYASVEPRDPPAQNAAAPLADRAQPRPPAEPGTDALREQIAAIARAIAELAPRNAVVGLEGAVRDLSERVEGLRRNGHAEQLLAPLDAMAGELRIALKAYDPQAAAAGLEREIRAIGGKIDGLAETAVKPETFEAIRRQTEEVNSLLTAAADRTLPLDGLERRIGQLADRIEKLNVSAAPQIESAQTAAALAELRRDVERAAPAMALAQIERRLEQIADRLDEAVAPHAQDPLDPKPFEDLARRIDGVREQMEKRTLPDLGTERLEASLKELTARLDRPPAPNARAAQESAPVAQPIEPLLREISGKLDKLPQPIAPSPVDMQPVEAAIRALNARFDEGAGRIDRSLIDELASETARRLGDRSSSATLDADLLARQIGDIHTRLDGLAALSPPDGEARWRAVADELKQSLSTLAAAPVEASNRLAIDLARMRSDQVTAERRTEANLTGLHEAIDTLVERLGVAERAESAIPLAPKGEPKAARATAEPPLRGVEALNDDDRKAADTLREPAAPTDVDDFLLEPGSGAPTLGREARDLAHAIGGKTSPAISAHIAAARRAAQAAHAEGGANGDGGAPLRAARIAARSAEFYTSHKRTLLLAATVVVVAVAAFRLVGPHGPLHQSSDLGAPARTVAVAPSVLPPEAAPQAAPPSPDRPIDTTPTASIGPASPPKTAASAPDLLAALPPGLPDPLREGVMAGTPAAEYELALRLLEGRGAPQDQPTAARWLERAAEAGLPTAEFRLGVLYEKGVGVPTNPELAEGWYRKAAEAGNVRAAHNLAVMAAQPTAGAPDYAEAVKWFRKAADMGVRDSQYNLAILYARGLGVDHDLSQSWLWFSLAASQGDADAARKRDDVAGKLDPAALSSAAQMLSRYKAQKPDPAANDAPAPPAGGWDARAAGPPGQSSVIPPPSPRVHTVM